ncbi:MAG: hypothetical protein Q4G11_06155, partial [Gallicola sp.]|nr:hypothetical protein [Gallicola sp.]
MAIEYDGDKIILDKDTQQVFEIDVQELYEGLENIGDYRGIESIRKELNNYIKNNPTTYTRRW